MTDPVQIRNDELKNLLLPDFQARYEPNFAWKSACAAFLALPALRGFWPMSSFNENGDAYDLSGQGRTLTYNGNPTYNYSSLIPYIDLDGVGDWLSRADEAGLDIAGTETYVAGTAQGLTMGCWLQFDDLLANEYIISKWDPGVAAQRSYRLMQVNTDVVRFSIHDGANADDVDSSDTISTTGWHFCVGRFIPSTEVAIWLNRVKDTTVAGIGASIQNSASPLRIGSTATGGSPLDGRVSLAFLCAAALSDSIISALFQQTRAMFNR